MSLTLTFIHHPSEIKRPFVFNSAEELIIALEPMARASLVQQGLTPLDTQAYLPTESQAAIIDKAAQLTAWLRANFDYRDEHGLSLSYQDTLVWSERLLLIHCLWALEILHQATRAHAPSLLQAAISQKRSTDFIMDIDEHYFGELAQQFAFTRGIKFRQLPIESKLINFRMWIVKTDKYLSRTALRPLCMWLGKRQLHQLQKIYTLIFGTDRYNQPQLAKQLASSFPNLARVLLVENGLGQWLFQKRAAIFTHTLSLSFIEALAVPHPTATENLRRTLDDLAQKILSAPDVFSFHNVSFAEIAAHYLQTRLTPFTLNLHQRAAALNLLFTTLRPAGIFSAGNRADDILLGELSRQLDLSALLISHGSHTVPLTEPARQEWLEHSTHLIRTPYPFVALQTPAAEDFLKVMPPPLPTQCLRTGPLLWGRPLDQTKSSAYRQKILAAHPSARFLVVHAGTTKFSRAARLFVYETPDEYLQSLKDLVQAVGELPEVHLVIRFRPMPQLSVADLQQLVPMPSHVTLSVTETFEEVLGAADLLVSFSSTTIEEALQNKVPVLLYGAGGRYQHLPAVVLDHQLPSATTAVYAVKQSTNLVPALKQLFTFWQSNPPEPVAFSAYTYTPADRNLIENWLELLLPAEAEGERGEIYPMY